MKKTRVILAGFGAMSKLAWFPLIESMPQVELVACVDTNPDAFGQHIAEGKLSPSQCFATLQAATQAVHADGVIVVTPPEYHESVCLDAITAGLPVLCEKPLAPSMAAAERIVSTAHQANLPLLVGQNRRHTPFIHTMRQLVASGALGKAGQVYVTFRQIFNRDSFRDQMAHPLLLDMSNHHFDTIRYVLGEEPFRVTALGWNPDWSRFAGVASAIAVFEYARNLRVVYDASWHTMSGNMTSNGCDWRIECEKGVILCEHEQIYVVDKGDYRSGSYGGERRPVPLVSMPYDTVPYLLNEFVQVIQGNCPPETSGVDNLRTLKMVFAAVESVDKGCPVLI